MKGEYETVCFRCGLPHPIWCPEPYPCAKWDPIRHRKESFPYGLPNVNETKEV